MDLRKLSAIEWLKINRYFIFWGMLTLAFAAMATAFWGIDSILSEIRSNAAKQSPIPIPEVSVYRFPGIWHNLTFIAGTRLFLLLPSIIVILLITNEITYRTLRQNIIDGLTRRQYFISKSAGLTALSLAFTIWLFLNGMLLGIINTPRSEWGSMFYQFNFIAGYFLQVLAFGFFALMLGLLLKKSLLAMGVLFVYTIMAEPIICHYIKKPINTYMPVQSIANLIELPNSPLMKMFGMEFREHIEWQGAVTVIGWMIVFAGVSWLLIKKRSL